MHTMVARISTGPSRPEEVARHLREFVVGGARQQPGFVSGQWPRGTDRREELGVPNWAEPPMAASLAAPMIAAIGPAPRR